jgi:cytochrome c oxidase subunit II
MWEGYLASASSYAQSIDNLILLVAVVVGFWFLAVETVFFILIIKFRHREGKPAQFVSGEEKHLKRWVSIPHLLVIVCDVLIVAAAIKVWVDIKQTLPPAERTIRVFARQYAWGFQEPGPDGVLDTADDLRTIDELHVIADITYHFELQSADVVHSFSVPAFRMKQDAIPGRTITGWFRATRAGTYDIQCTQMCGIGHALMAGRIVVEDPQTHAAWMQRMWNPPSAKGFSRAPAASETAAVSAASSTATAEVRQ